MNNKIRELVELAKQYCFEQSQKRLDPEEYMPYSDMYDKKFAELIVQECATICDTIGKEARKEWKTKYNPHDDGRADGAWQCETAILEHFGVEE